MWDQVYMKGNSWGPFFTAPQVATIDPVINPIYSLLEELGKVEFYRDSMPEGHPKRKEWDAIVDRVWDRIEAERRKIEGLAK